MKKVIAIVALVLGITVAASAQPKALGVRAGGWYTELSYQHTLGAANFLEVDLGWWYTSGINVAAAYDFNIAPVGPFNFYAGPAADLFTFGKDDNGAGIGLGIGAQVGIEYTFDAIPFQISLDWRPMVNIIPGVGFGYEGIGLGLRYAF